MTIDPKCMQLIQLVFKDALHDAIIYLGYIQRKLKHDKYATARISVDPCAMLIWLTRDGNHNNRIQSILNKNMKRATHIKDLFTTQSEHVCNNLHQLV